MNTVQIKQFSVLSTYNYVHKRTEEKLLHSRTKVAITQGKNKSFAYMLSDINTTVQIKQFSVLSTYNYVHKRTEEKLLHSRTKVAITQGKNKSFAYAF